MTRGIYLAWAVVWLAGRRASKSWALPLPLARFAVVTFALHATAAFVFMAWSASLVRTGASPRVSRRDGARRST